MAKKARVHRDLEVYQKAFDAAMRIFELSKAFPNEERNQQITPNFCDTITPSPTTE